MKAGTENRKKTIAAAALGTLALICAIYIYNSLFAGSSPATPPPSITSPAKPAQTVVTTPANNAGRPAAIPTGNAAGVDAKRIATASTSLDPTLDQSAMLRTEHLVYAGSGRNIFSAIYTPPVVIPKVAAPIRKVIPCPPNCPPPPPPPPPPPTCPPTCPPINLKFFGTATRSNGTRQAFMLQGDDVFLASAGDIIARRFKIVAVNANSVSVEDLTNTNTQELPLQK